MIMTDIGMTEVPLNLPGRVFRSDMPWSIQYDEEGALIDAYREKGISTVVVLTPEHEIQSNTGKDLIRLYRSEGWGVLYLPVKNLGVPEADALISAVREALDLARSGQAIVAHCHAGIGRTGMFLAVMAGMALGLDGASAIRYIRKYIFGAVETPEQHAMVIDILSRI